MSVLSLQESVVKFRRHHFDLVFMDRHLSDGDGLNFPKMLTRNLVEKKDLDGLPVFGATKVFLVTAEIYLQPNGDSRLSPFAGVLHKPVSLAELKRAINSTLPSDPACGAEQTRVVEPTFDLLRQKLSRNFIEGLPSLISSIREMLAHRDYAGIEFVAHRLMGSAGNAGLIEIAELAVELHKTASEENQKCIEVILSQLADKLVVA